ncbi:MAG: lactate utilization protein [Endomicrobia bacterium]|nr:lactate utilization protein [Endomicrobiia bacterium]
MQDENVAKFNKNTLVSVQKNLLKNGFKETKVFDNIIDCKSYILNLVSTNKTVGIGGSQTVKSLGIVEELKKTNTIITHTQEMDTETRQKIWLKAQQSDFYIASPQAITLKGEIILIDAYGNRIVSCILGPKKVVLIAGVNKIAKDFETAIWRTRNVAAVINNIRLKRQNPCVTTNFCQDCDSTTRICNILTVLYKKPPYTEYEILLVNENLGY